MGVLQCIADAAVGLKDALVQRCFGQRHKTTPLLQSNPVYYFRIGSELPAGALAALQQRIPVLAETKEEAQARVIVYYVIGRPMPELLARFGRDRPLLLLSDSTQQAQAMRRDLALSGAWPEEALFTGAVGADAPYSVEENRAQAAALSKMLAAAK